MKVKPNKLYIGFQFFAKGLNKSKTEVLVSLQVVVTIALCLSVILYLVEHHAQPDVYASFWKNVVWSFVTFLDNPPPTVIVHNPVTAVGQILWGTICLLKIVIFAVPTGLIANGFSEAMDENKQEEELNKFRIRLQNAFSSKLARRVNDYIHTQGIDDKYYMLPSYESITQLQVKYHLDTTDVLKACEKFPEFRLANMASIQTEAEDPIDRLVVLHSWLNRPYGCCINRNSKVTIVATSAYTELPTEWFGYYLALFGGFNYICRSVVEDYDHAQSYYNMHDNPQDANQTLFYNDLKTLTQGEDHWTIYLLQQVTNANKEGNHISFSSAMREGKQPTINDTAAYVALKQAIVDMFAQYDLHFQTEESKRFPLSENNVAYRLRRDGISNNAFTLRLAAHLMAKHTHREQIAYRLAETINTALATGCTMTEEDRHALCQRM